MTDQTNMKGIQLRQSTLEFSFKQKLNFTVCVENYLYQAMPADLIWWKFSVMCVIKILMYFIYLTTFSFGSCCSFDHMKLKISPAPPPPHTQADQKEGIQPLARGKEGKVSGHDSGN